MTPMNLPESLLLNRPGIGLFDLMNVRAARPDTLESDRLDKACFAKRFSEPETILQARYNRE